MDDLSLSNSRALLPRSLYWFLRWVVTGEEYEGGKEGFREMCEPCSNIADEITMTSQDLVHCISHARVTPPKHVGLGISVRHLTGSKQLITILNRMGHCCSYEEVELVDTSLTNEILPKSDETGVIIPSNIHPGVFVQMAADNNDINEETMDGKNTAHAATLFVYQRKQNGPMPPRQIHANHSQRRRSLDSARNTLAIEEVSLCSRRAPPTSFLSQIKMEWFQCNNQFLSPYTQDAAWMLLRLHPTSIFKKALVYHYLSRAFQGGVGFILVFSPKYQSWMLLRLHPTSIFKKALVCHYLSRAFQGGVGFILVFSPKYQSAQ